jgi:hypothetical protein
MQDTIATFLTAHASTGDDRWLDVARRGGEFLLRPQLPEPQPTWVQQYDRRMQLPGPGGSGPGLGCGVCRVGR